MVIIKSFVSVSTAQSLAINTQTGRATEMVFMCLGSWIYVSLEKDFTQGVLLCLLVHFHR